MKQTLTIFIFFLSFISCSDFLDVDDKTKVANHEMFSTLDGANTALNGIYYFLGDKDYYGRALLVTPGIKGGNLKMNEASSNPIVLYFKPSYEFTHGKEEDDYTEGVYAFLYKFINTINTLVNNIDNAKDASELQRLQILAEARALRALAHFDLTRLYAQPYVFSANAQHMGVPYLKNNITFEDTPVRDLLFDNYEDIIEDLKFAEENIDESIKFRKGEIKTPKAYLSKTAIQALLARVYLYKSDWDNAKAYATKVIKSGKYTLVNKDEVVSSSLSNTVTSEDIFLIHSGGRSSKMMATTIGITDGGEKVYYWLVSDDLLNLYEEGDSRKQLFETKDGKTVTAKYREFIGKDRNLPVLRLAEMYLIRAEANLNLPTADEVQARADLDFIRKRANPDAPNLQLTGKALREELFNERRRELAFEGHLFFDIARMKRSLKRVDCNASQNKELEFPHNFYVLPFPEEAILYNPKMKQNPGY